ncbi:MAG: RNA polymerase sigma factor [Planctomycetota bacterium]
MTRDEERQLIERAIAGDRGAAAACIQAYERSLYAYLLRMSGKPDIAEDICQEAFVRVLTHIERFDFRYRFSTWLFTIAKRLYLNYAQKMKPAYDTETVSGRRGKDAPPAEPVMAQERQTVRRSAIDEAMQQLSMEQREILVLFHQQDWPISLIAGHLDMPEGTVKSHLHRGRKKLRDLLRETAKRPLAEIDGEAMGVEVASGTVSNTTTSEVTR